MPRVELKRLDDAPVSHTMAVPRRGDGEPDFLSLPAAPGVVVLESREGRTLLIAMTADARELARRKLGESAGQTGERAGAGRVDCRDDTERVAVIRVGSMLEADAVYLRQARERLPRVHRVVSERWRAWFAHVDPEAEHPQWSKTNLLGLVRGRSASVGVSARGSDGTEYACLIGPLPDKDAAGRFLEAVTDAFDLCRFHHLLVQSPRASACAYKEMGRCPAPCDGTESMEAYRERTREAVEALGSGSIEQGVARIEEQMRVAAVAQEYERGAALKKIAERMQNLRTPAFAHVGRLDRWAVLAVLPSTTARMVRGAVLWRGELLALPEVSGADVNRSAAAIAAGVSAVIGGSKGEMRLSEEAIETVGLVSRHLFLPVKKRSGVMMTVREGVVDAGAVARAVKAVGGSKCAKVGVEDRELEAGGPGAGGTE